MKRLATGALVVVWLAWMAGLVHAAPPPGKLAPAQAAAIIQHAPEARRLHIVRVECLPYVGRWFACVLIFDPPLRGHRCFAAPFVVRPRIEYDATLAKWCDQAGGGRTPPSS